MVIAPDVTEMSSGKVCKTRAVIKHELFRGYGKQPVFYCPLTLSLSPASDGEGKKFGSTHLPVVTGGAGMLC